MRFALPLLLPIFVQSRYVPGAEKKPYVIDGQYIASIRGTNGSCNNFVTQVKTVQAKYGQSRAAQPQKAEMIGVDECWVLFEGSPEMLSDVRALDNVYDIEPHYMFQPLKYGEQDPSRSPNDPISWGLNRIDQNDMPLSFGTKFTSGYTGKGVTVYMLDSGFESESLDWTGRLSCAQDLIKDGAKGGEPCADTGGHGSHTTGTATGHMAGVARDAQVFHLKVCGDSGCPGFALTQAMTWVKNDHATRKTPAVLSFSIGGPKSTSSDNQAKSVSDSGVIFVAAAGNDDDDACNHSPAAAGGKARTTYGVITVGSSDRKDQRSDFSNYGKCVDIYAPGSDIMSVMPGGAQVWQLMSGTSMATPLVSGVLATLLEKHAGDRKKAVDEMFATAVPNKLVDPAGVASKVAAANLLLQATRGNLVQVPYANFEGPKYSQVCVGDDCITHIEGSVGTVALGPVPVTGALAFPAADEPIEGCNATSGSAFKNNYAGKVLAINRGSCTFVDKVRNALKAGAKGVILVNNVAGADPIPAGGDGSPINIPVVMVSLEVGNSIRSRSGAVVTMGVPKIGGNPTPTAPPQTSPTKEPTSQPTTSNPTSRPTSAPPTPKPTAQPTPLPTTTKTPTSKAPTSSGSDGWTCRASYFNAKDGCDCGCGIPDPDCTYQPGERTYCYGETKSRPNEYCNPTDNQCYKVRPENQQPNVIGVAKEEAPAPAGEGDDTSMVIPIAAGVGGLCMVALGSLVAIKTMKRNTAAKTEDSAVANPRYNAY